VKTYIIQLESHDDVISVRDKMGWSKAPRILLIWPRRGNVLGRQVDLTLLQRRAASLGAQLGVVTRQEAVMAYAQELGIPVFRGARQAQQSRWRRPRGHARRLDWRKGQRAFVPPDELRLQRAAFKTETPRPGWLRLSAFAVGVLAVLALMAFFLPSAQVRLAPALRPQELTLDVWADPTIPVANPSGGMPAREISVVVEGSEQAPSTGSTSLPGRTADGRVVFTNLTAGSVDIPAETVVVTLDVPAVRFATTRAVTLEPGSGSTVEAPVRALTPGSAGNVEAGQVQALEGNTGLSVTVTNPTAIDGGTDQSGLAPTAKDYEGLYEKMLAALNVDAVEELTQQLNGVDALLPETVQVKRVLEAVREPEPGQPGDYARLRLRVEYTGWTIQPADLEQVAQTALEVDRPQNYQVVDGSLVIEQLSQPVMDENGRVRWQVKASRSLRAQWTDAQVAQALAGRSRGDAAEWLSSVLELAEAPQIQMSPNWWQRMPFLAFRIGVKSQ